jgi:hypothetical protein
LAKRREKSTREEEEAAAAEAEEEESQEQGMDIRRRWERAKSRRDTIPVHRQQS